MARGHNQGAGVAWAGWLVLAACVAGMPACSATSADRPPTPEPTADEIAHAAALRERIAAEQAVVLDVRKPHMFRERHIVGAMNIPAEEIANRFAEIPSGRPVAVYCRIGRKTTQVAAYLRQQGFEVWEIDRLNTWIAAGGDVTPAP